MSLSENVKENCELMLRDGRRLSISALEFDCFGSSLLILHRLATNVCCLPSSRELLVRSNLLGNKTFKTTRIAIEFRSRRISLENHNGRAKHSSMNYQLINKLSAELEPTLSSSSSIPSDWIQLIQTITFNSTESSSRSTCNHKRNFPLTPPTVLQSNR